MQAGGRGEATNENFRPVGLGDRARAVLSSATGSSNGGAPAADGTTTPRVVSTRLTPLALFSQSHPAQGRSRERGGTAACVRNVDPSGQKLKDARRCGGWGGVSDSASSAAALAAASAFERRGRQQQRVGCGPRMEYEEWRMGSHGQLPRAPSKTTRPPADAGPLTATAVAAALGSTRATPRPRAYAHGRVA